MTVKDRQQTQLTSVPEDPVVLETIEVRITEGPDRGRLVSFCTPNIRIGSGGGMDITLTDRTVSRLHAQIALRDGQLMIKDLGSSNGTQVNGVRISEAYLPPGARCRLGSTELMVVSRAENRVAEPQLLGRLGDMVGCSEQMQAVYARIRNIAPTAASVLIQGESGTGKEMIARTLHQLSGRKGPFVVFDASVADPEMVRNDLFGHVRGAFTGASGEREGAFRHAHRGTLFIDEIGELPIDLQPRLLRVLESREVTPIGSDRSEIVDVRVVAATHRDLQVMVAKGQFRQDLYYRLNVVPISAPPLREIKSDIPHLVAALLQRLELDVAIAPDVYSRLAAYDWPGNVRELRNVLERAVAIAGDETITADHLLLAETDGMASVDTLVSGDRSLKEVEKELILTALARSGNNKTAAARSLGMSLSTLKRRLAQYD